MSLNRSAKHSSPQELSTFAEILCQSRGLRRELAPRLIDRVGVEHVRLAWCDDQVVGGLAQIPMGHWFGGREVSSVGLTYGAVAPEHRSRGVLTRLLESSLRELKEAGVPLSSLYAASQGPCRRVGYEVAGSRTVYRVHFADLRADGRAAQARVASAPEDWAKIRSLYDARARCAAGFVARTDYLWRRIRTPFNVDSTPYLLEDDGVPVGYVVMSQRASERERFQEVSVHDAVLDSSAAVHRCMRLLGDHAMVGRSATIVGAPTDALLLHTRPRLLDVCEVAQLMLRIVDVRLALMQRGWPQWLGVELHLEIRDDLLRENARRWILEVHSGRAEIREGGSGAVRLDIRGLAALYSGFMSCNELRAAGLCEGEADELARASWAFSGPTPSVMDQF